MKHIQIKLTDIQSGFFLSIKKRYPWMKMTTKNDIVYFPENNIIDVYILIINKGTNNSSFRSLIKKLDKIIEQYDPKIQLQIKEHIEQQKIMEIEKAEKELQRAVEKEEELRKKREKEHTSVVITEEKKKENYKLVTMKVYEV